MKIDRLLAITIYLLNHGRTSARKLAQHFEVSTRTITRDMDTLCLAGIPVASTCGVEGGYEIMDGFEMDRQTASQRDYSYIVTALEGLASAYSNKDIEAALEKMNGFVKDRENTVFMDLGVVHENRDTNEMLFLLNRAIQMKHKIEFVYTNSEDETKLITAEPAGVIYKWYNWYLIGYHPGHQDYCMFKIVRMDELRITEKENEKVHSPKEIRLKLDTQEDLRQTMEIVLFCKVKLKSRCREYLNGRIIKEYENGDFEYQFTVPEGEQFWYGVLLSFGKDARVLSPEKLIDRIIENCSSLLEMYQSNSKTGY